MKFESAFVGDLSGSVGGLTASRARGGVDYFRFRATPTNPDTALQQTVRSALATLSQRWGGTLTQSERDSWIAAADGSPKQGLNLYVAANTPRIQGGLDIVDELTGSAGTDVSTVVVSTVSAGAITVTFDNTDTWANTDDAALMLYATRPIPPSRTFEQRERLTLTVLGDATTAPSSPAAGTYSWGNLPTSGDELRFRGLVTMPDGTITVVPVAAITV